MHNGAKYTVHKESDSLGTKRSFYTVQATLLHCYSAASDWISKCDRLEKCVSAVQIIINDDMVVRPGKLGILELKLGGLETFLHSGSGFRPPTDKALAQDGQGGWSDETIDGV